MKGLILFIAAVYLLLSVTGCQTILKKSPSPDTSSPGEDFRYQVRLIHACLDSAETYQYELDTTKINRFYRQALNSLDSLTLIYAYDLNLQDLSMQALDSYEEYQLLLEGLEEDSLDADEAFQDLAQLYAMGSDSSAPDTSHKLLDKPALKIPIETNYKVERAINYFTRGKGRKIFTRWLERAGKYEALVKNVIRQEGAPEELFYLAMIESGLNPKARSYARAVGMWQFISSTGHAYELRHSWWFDERQDPVKSSRAAARHLLDLYERFGDWYLAIAGYNFNPNKIEKRLASHNVSDFWELPRLPRQTRNYVPTFLAALIIASEPEKQGFDIIPEEALQFDTVTVKECLDLNVVADCVGGTFSELKELNPALLRWCTPPDVDNWVLNLPRGSRNTFLAKYQEMPKEQKTSWAHHRVRSGETLSAISRRYQVSVAEIKRFNNLRGTLIRAGQGLVIPVPREKAYYQEYRVTQTPPKATLPAKPVTNVPGRDKQLHVVRQGESLWEISMQHGVTVQQIRSWNGLGYSRIIQPGQELAIWLKREAVDPGSTRAAQPVNDSLQPKLASSDDYALPNGKTILHRVRHGDTLWDIAQVYSVSIEDIKEWNGMRNNTIRPGDELKIVQYQ